MPPNPTKYRSVTQPLIFMLVFPLLGFLYFLALCIGLTAHLLKVFACCCCCPPDNCLVNGLLVVANSLVEAAIRVNKDEQVKSLPYQPRTTNPPSTPYYPQNHNPISPVPAAQMPINQYSNMTYQDRQLQAPVLNPPSPVNIIVDYQSWSVFTYEDLLEATNGFSVNNFLGEGGFGFVHQGILSDGREVAIKQLKSDHTWGQREFRSEVDVLSRVHHRHLVQYFGCCITQDKSMIVCEYMPNKTVDHHLHGNREGTIDWPTRLKISIGAAKGLAYLHEECQPRIIHRDIKAANILLDPSFEAKVADFGMAKFFPDGMSLIVATNLMGTLGYLAPEFSMGEIREKSDTFAFGVVLLELITGKKPIISRSVISEEPYQFETLANWAGPLLTEALQNGNYDPLVDSRLSNIYNYNEMKRMIACAAACVRQLPQNRPSMSKVALVLAGQTSPDDLFIGVESTQVHTAASISSMDFQEPS